MAGTSSLSISASGGDRIDKAIAALEDGRDELVERIGEVIYDLASRRADAAKALIMTEPTHGMKHTGLRARIAAGVGVEDVSGGSRVFTSVPEADEAAIPRGFDPAVSYRAQPGTWRHPLFGNKARWYRNDNGAVSWFIGAFDGADVEGEEKLDQMMDDVAKGIARQIDY